MTTAGSALPGPGATNTMMLHQCITWPPHTCRPGLDYGLDGVKCQEIPVLATVGKSSPSAPGKPAAGPQPRPGTVAQSMATMTTGGGHSALRQTTDTAAREIGCAHPALGSQLYTRARSVTTLLPCNLSST